MVPGRLSKAGIEEPWQVPLYLPVAYLDATQPVTQFSRLPVQAHDLVVAGRYAGDLRSQFKPGKPGEKRRPFSTGTLLDETGRALKFSFFGHAKALETALNAAPDRVYLHGEIRWIAGQVYLNDPKPLDPTLIGRLVPCYPGVPGKLAPATLRRLLAEQLPATIPLAAEQIRLALRPFAQGKALRDLIDAPPWTLDLLLAKTHWPDTQEEAQRSQEVLERLAALLSIAAVRRSTLPTAVARPPLHYPAWPELLKAIPFTLTAEQHNGITQLIERLAAPHTSSTLINGDVGMGKSILYQVALAMTAKAGGRGAVLLPNERLAQQAHGEIQALWPELSPLLVNKKTRHDVRDARILVGTTALLFRDIGALDVCVTDEQHRFSVEQRVALAQQQTHLIEMSATPIPRTQAILTYGNLNVIRLTQRHSAQAIDTQIVQRAQTWSMVEHIQARIALGDRVLIVCPRKMAAEADDTDEAPLPLPSVDEVAAKWEKLFPGRIRTLHSDTPEEAAQVALSDIRQGRADVIVATTVLECGLTIEGLRALIVVHAERFGVAQLHQLRGRLSRQGGYGICYLYLPRPVGERSMARLRAVASTNDGFKLSELDMTLRGFGDLTEAGQRQHGSVAGFFFNKTVSLPCFEQMLAKVAEQHSG